MFYNRSERLFLSVFFRHFAGNTPSFRLCILSPLCSLSLISTLSLLSTLYSLLSLSFSILFLQPLPMLSTVPLTSPTVRLPQVLCLLTGASELAAASPPPSEGGGVSPATPTLSGMGSIPATSTTLILHSSEHLQNHRGLLSSLKMKNKNGSRCSNISWQKTARSCESSPGSLQPNNLLTK